MKLIIIFLISSTEISQLFANPSAVSNSFCGDTVHFKQIKGKISTTLDGPVKVSNCSWFIIQPEQSVIWIKILNLHLEGYGLYQEYNCLNFLSAQNQSYTKICNADEINASSLSFPTNSLQIILELYTEPPASKITVELNYASYLVHCDHEKLRCPTYSTAEDPEEPCFEGLINCGEQCRVPTKEVPCGDIDGNICYDVWSKRCNSVLDCYNGEDEVGCDPGICPDSINCPKTTQCITRREVCNNITDCQDGFDENHCETIATKVAREKDAEINNESKNEQIFYVIITIITVLSISFMTILVRCYSKGNVRRLLEAPPRHSLPPFYGQGEADTVSESDSENDEPQFKPGGELFEGFLGRKSNLQRGDEKLQDPEKEVRFIQVLPPFDRNLYQKYFGLDEPPFISEDLIALASIKMTKVNCIGLKKAKSEIEKKVSKVLFLDHPDDKNDSSSEEEEERRAKKSVNKHNIEVKSKSDTLCHRSKNSIGINFV